ncbi:hypothetical protein [Thalassomonas haliotis]|uniref:Uncharacterized protein n=1 Tax=Thalassomonas haliotis TaxID=485448 RepID=A0ABY7VDD0_9GAMM|nr:hypothetical protein [Thalassomonas haliotis]WDE11124.1 hypothetical protein H3N35_23270 [Thalassomonas haliotis]
MKIFPRILALYAGDYKRQSHGDIFFWLLLFTAILIFALVYIARLDFQDVYAAKGQVIRVKHQQKDIRVEIPPSRASQIQAGNRVIVIDNQHHSVTSVISTLAAEETERGPYLAAYVSCSDCLLVFSQEVQLHIITRQSSVLDMFTNSFFKE